MKAIVNRASFLEALTAVSAVASGRTPKPILECVKLTATANHLTLSATDLEIGIRYTTSQVQVESEGETLVSAAKLKDIVRESNDDTLSLVVVNDQLNVAGQDSLFKINTQSPADFPPVPDLVGEADFEVQASVLQRLVAQTIFAAAKEATRYAFNGVLTTVQQQRLVMVATDGRRLAVAKGDLVTSNEFSDSGKTIVPAKVLSLIGKLISDPEAAISVKLTENQIIFRTEDATLTSNLIEGAFPPFQDVLPKDCDRKLTASRSELNSAVRRSALLTTAESKGVRMAFTKRGLTVSSRDADAGEATINFASRFEGSDLEIGFNPHFFMDGLKVAVTDEVTFEMTAANRPGLLKAGPDFQYVIMPVNLQ